MVSGLWGRKIGMAQVFANDKVIPVTAIDVSDWLVTNVRTTERDGYAAIQVGKIKKRYSSKDFSTSWLKKPKNYFSFLREIKVTGDVPKVAIGQRADFLSLLSEGDNVDVFGLSKGCGFAGVVKRYRFGGPPGSHGATMGKRPGSIGFMRSQGKVIKGKKMPGQMGNKNQVMQNLQVVKVEQDAQLLLVKGSIPGKAGTLVFVRKA